MWVGIELEFRPYEFHLPRLSTEFLIGLMIFHQQLSNRIAASVRISAPEPFFFPYLVITASSHEAIEKLVVDVTLLVCVFYNHHHSVY
jgi:hypothetical protein